MTRVDRFIEDRPTLSWILTGIICLIAIWQFSQLI